MAADAPDSAARSHHGKVTPGRAAIVAVVWTMAAMVLPVRAAGHVEASRAIAVRVIDRVGVPLTIRQRALEQAARLFERVDVTIVWDNSNRLTSVPSRLLVVDLNVLDHGDHSLPTGNVLGSATPSPIVPTISVFYGDVQELAHTFGVPPEVLFGSVIAHELGHLLLGPRAHTRLGLMRPVWTRTDVVYGVAQGQFRFSAAEGERMRRRLQSSRRCEFGTAEPTASLVVCPAD